MCQISLRMPIARPATDLPVELIIFMKERPLHMQPDAYLQRLFDANTNRAARTDYQAQKEIYFVEAFRLRYQEDFLSVAHLRMLRQETSESPDEVFLRFAQIDDMYQPYDRTMVRNPNEDY